MIAIPCYVTNLLTTFELGFLAGEWLLWLALSMLITLVLDSSDSEWPLFFTSF